MMLVDLPTYIHQCALGVAASTMSAIIRTESKGNPLALGLNRGKKLKFQPLNYEQAASWVKYLDNHGYDFDIGLGQVNIRNVKKYGFSAVDMLDPCMNLKLSSLILKKNYSNALTTSNSSKEALLKAISAYNTGNYNRGFNNGYVQRVVNNASYNNKTLTIARNLEHESKVVQPISTNPYKYNTNNHFSKTIIYAKNKTELQNNSSQFAQNY